jgi:ankyrin repeat protein
LDGIVSRQRPGKRQQTSPQKPHQTFEFVFHHQSPGAFMPSSSSNDTEWFSNCMQNLQQPSNNASSVPSALGCEELLAFSAATGFPQTTLTSDGELQQYQQRPDPFGHTALHLAASKGFPCVCQRLIRYGAALEAREETSGRTPLHMASFHGFVDVVTILITGGALVTAEDSMGMTPLSLAVNSGNEAVVEVLLSHGADPNQRM